MPDDPSHLGVCASSPVKPLDLPPSRRPEPVVWTSFTQGCIAGLIGLALVLLGWRGWGLSRYSPRPLPLERGTARHSVPAPAYLDSEPAPRLVRAKVDELPIVKGMKISPQTPLDLNRASQEELMQLPGIGPVLSSRIIEGRPYHSIADLRRVKGIGPKTFENIKPYVRTSP